MIVGAVLARNEADRYLRRCLTNMLDLCDKVLLLDDHSTDSTPHLARELGVQVRERKDPAGAWWSEQRASRESVAREELWTWASSQCGIDDWCFIWDADHEVMGLTRQDLSYLTTRDAAVTAWACPLLDLWNDETTHRTDGWWGLGPISPRIWLAKAWPHGLGVKGVWPAGGLHVGHVPPNFQYVAGLMPPGVFIKHYGYLKKEDRIAKHRRYLANA